MSDASALPDWSGKLVLLYVSDAPHGVEDGVVFEYPEFRVLGARLFLLGRIPEVHGHEWVAKLQSGVAWDSVVSYVLFDSREDYQQRMATAQPTGLRRLLSPRGSA